MDFTNTLFATLTLVLVLIQLSSYSSALPVGFIDELVVSRDAIITGAFANNPRNGNKPMLLLSTKNGQIYAVEDPDNSEDNVLVADFNEYLCVNGERGLQSIKPHPNFTDNRYIYLFYTKYVDGCPESAETGPPNRVSRFVMDPETLMLDYSTEFVLLETSPSPKKMHNGGSMSFGVDNYLYVTTGDGGMRDPSYSQDLSILFGKILRIDENGDAPDSNPFTTANGGKGVPCGKSGTGFPPDGSPDGAVCEEIYAYGLRNPFRLAMDYNSEERVLFSIGDVGASVWEEVSHGGEDYIGVNYGWPMKEGPCNIGTSDNCAVDASLVEPYHFYLHTQLEEGGCFVGSVFVPNDIGWPEKYKYLFIDFIFNTTYNLIEAPDNACRDCIPPRPGYINETFYEREVMIDMFFGPYMDTQALYVISRGTGQSIRRIRYTGTSNVAPVANITISTVTADVNEPIVFDGSTSSDSDGDSITFLWDFGDGTTSTEALTEHAFELFGRYTVKLTVTDALGQTNQVYEIVSIGIPPIANMISPKIDERFAVGQQLRVLGNATDAFGELLNDTQIAWEVRQHHSKHFHPFLDRESGTGNNFKLDPAPSPEDFLAADNSYLEVIMYATDSFGLVTTVSRDVYPKKVIILVDSNPQGLEVLVDEYPVITPKNVSSWENHKLHLNVLDQADMTFASWSIGGSRKTNYTVPARQLSNPTVMVTLTNNAPEASPVSAPEQKMTSSPVTAPVDVVESSKPTDAPIAAPAPAPVTTNAVDLGSTSNAAKSHIPLQNFHGTFVILTIISSYIFGN